MDGLKPGGLTLINGTARLQGNGVVGHAAPDSGSCVVAPGVSPGLLTCSNLNLAGTGGGIVEMELNGTSPGSGHDQIVARGGVNLSGMTLNASLNFASSLSNQFVIIANDGADAAINTFTGLPQDATLMICAEQFRISYTGGDGNDVVLTQISGAFRPTLAIERIPPASVRLLWATNNATGFGLQSNINLSTSNWTAVSPPPTLVGTNNVVTNTASGQRFYRLFKP